MNPSKAVRILAACGVALAGPVTSDAFAFARAVDIGSRKALLLFAQENPQSKFAERAMKLSDNVAIMPSLAGLSFVPGLQHHWIENGQNKLMKLTRGDGPNGGGKGGGSPGGNANNNGNSTNTSKQTQAVAVQQQVVSQINTKLSQFTREAERCRGDTFNVAQTCIADALDKFSRGLDTVRRTSGGVTTVAIPALRKAAEGIRTARNKKEARAAIAAAVPVIRNSIDLVMAGGDDSVYRLQVRQRSLVIKSLTISDKVLVQATGI